MLSGPSEALLPTCLASREDALRIAGDLEAARNHSDRTVLDLRQVEPGYPEGCVTLAAYLHRLQGTGMTVETRTPDRPWLRSIGLPLDSAAQEHPFARVWRYTSTRELSTIIDRLLDATSGAVACSEGVLQSLEWSLNEVCDNVLQHAEAGSGFVMLQHHRASNRMTASIADSGVGIHASLGPSLSSPVSEIESIRLSLKEGVTRDGHTNQGNGLWGLTRLVTANAGRLRISSGSSAVSIKVDQVDSGTPLGNLVPSRPGTTVTFDIDGSRPINVVSSIGHSPINLRAEAVLGDSDQIQVRLADGHDLGTRDGGRELWNRVWNSVVESRTNAVLDFTDVSIVSSSFADEFIAQPILRLGFTEYTSTFELTHMNPAVSGIIDRAVMQRLRSGLPEPIHRRTLPKDRLERDKHGRARVRMAFDDEEASRIESACDGEMPIIQYLHRAIQEHVSWRIGDPEDR